MTAAVTEIPQVIRQFLPGFEPVFSKPQLQHFAEFEGLRGFRNPPIGASLYLP